VLGLVVLGSGVKESAQLILFIPSLRLRSVLHKLALKVSGREIWQQVYKQLPYLPLENQYVNETQQVDSNNNGESLEFDIVYVTSFNYRLGGSWR